MTQGCKIDKQDGAYFLTFTTVEWVDVFKEDKYKLIVCESLNYCVEKHTRNKIYQLWQHNNHPEEVYSPKFTLRKIKYIHNNPVEAGLVDRPEDYLFSSAVDYAGGKCPVIISLLNMHNLYS